MVGSAAPHERPQLTQEDHVGKDGQRRTTQAGGEGEGIGGLHSRESSGVFGITGDWSDAALSPGAWYTVTQYAKGVAGSWSRGRGRRRRRPKTDIGRERQKGRTRLRLHLGGGPWEA